MSSEADVERPWRCFLAVPIPESLKVSLADAVAIMRTDPQVEADWRFADPGGWHVTLAFLGAVAASSIGPLVDGVSATVRDLEPFEVGAGGLGGFPYAGTLACCGTALPILTAGCATSRDGCRRRPASMMERRSGRTSPWPVHGGKEASTPRSCWRRMSRSPRCRSAE
jgi:hypothetical protein